MDAEANLTRLPQAMNWLVLPENAIRYLRIAPEKCEQREGDGMDEKLAVWRKETPGCARGFARKPSRSARRLDTPAMSRPDFDRRSAPRGRRQILAIALRRGRFAAPPFLSPREFPRFEASLAERASSRGKNSFRDYV